MDSWGLIPNRGKKFFSTVQCPDQLLGPPSLQRVPGAIFLRVRQLVREGDHSPQSSVKVKNGGAIISIPPFSWYGAYLINHRDSFALFFFSFS
jgi:hypothetical protein